jgi:hypothetical protein
MKSSSFNLETPMDDGNEQVTGKMGRVDLYVIYTETGGWLPDEIFEREKGNEPLCHVDTIAYSYVTNASVTTGPCSLQAL